MRATKRLSKRQYVRLLRDEGFVLARNTKHEVWKHPDGRMVKLPMSPSHSTLYPVSLRKAKALI